MKKMNRRTSETEKKWKEINDFNREMVDEFLENQVYLSPQTLGQYKSGLRIFFIWVSENLHDKDFTEIKKKEFVRYLNWLTARGLSESAIKFKKAAVASFCNYVISMYEDEYPNFRKFVTSEMRVVKTGYVHEKKPLTTDEYNKLCKDLEDREEWQILAWVKFSYSTGCRRAESRQLLKEVVDYSPIVKKVEVIEDGEKRKVKSVSYKTHKIRCKGRSIAGKVRQLQFSQEAMDAIKKWLEVRGDDNCPYVFVTKHGRHYEQVAEETFNLWCSGLLTELVGRRVHPHLFRESRATNIVVEEGRSVEVAQKLLGHESSDTTLKHYVIREDADDADEAFI